MIFAAPEWSQMAGLLSTYQEYMDLDPRVSVSAGDTVIDLGAHIGSFCMPLLWQNPGVTVIAYEPDPLNTALIEENRRANDIRPQQLIVRQQAVSGKRGRARFCVGRTSTKGTLEGTGFIKSRKRKIAEKIDVETVTLSDVFVSHGIDKCRLLKVDTEGSEYDILLGSERHVLSKVAQIIVEAHSVPGREPEQLRAQLTEWGYKVSARDRHNGCWEYSCRRGDA